MLKDFKKKQETKTSQNSSDKMKEVNRLLMRHLKKENDTLNHFEIIGYLGEGTYALVNLAFDRSRQTKVALKIFDKKTLIVTRRLSNLIVCLKE